jgi:hypothetical protein
LEIGHRTGQSAGYRPGEEHGIITIREIHLGEEGMKAGELLFRP